jgi:hypothetical protein
VSEEGAIPAVGAARANRKATSSLAATGRSIKHPTYYLVGSIYGHEVYWHPALGYSFESRNPGHQLVALEADHVDLTWADDDALAPLLRDVQTSGGRLLDAMDARMRVYIDTLLEDLEFAGECEREKSALLVEAIPVGDGLW